MIGAVGTSEQPDVGTPAGVQRGGTQWGRGDSWRNNDQSLSKSGKRHLFTDLRSSVNPKQDKYE